MASRTDLMKLPSNLAPQVALISLALLALVEVILVVQAAGKRIADARPTPLASLATPTVAVQQIPPPVFTPPSSLPELPTALGKVAPMMPPPLPSALVQPQTTTLASSMAPRPPLPPGREIKNQQIMDTVEGARQARILGDMQAALEALKAADLNEPGHPEILSEMAMTYEAMGLGDKSQSAWSRVRAMGLSGAGGYYRLAVSKLSSAPEEPTAQVASNIKALKLGKCEIERDPSSKREKWTLRIPLVAVEGELIDTSAMDIQIYFFEKSGERIEQAAPERSSTGRWKATPVFATSKPEMLTVDYIAPAQQGNKFFHGYMVKVYYKNQLMGEQAFPETLLQFKPPGKNRAGADNALLPPAN